jgi:hypothetical protein
MLKYFLHFVLRKAKKWKWMNISKISPYPCLHEQDLNLALFFCANRNRNIFLFRLGFDNYLDGQLHTSALKKGHSTEQNGLKTI